MKISDINYVEDIKQEEKLDKVVGGTFGLLSWIFGNNWGSGYNQQPQTTVINNIYVNNTSSSTSSSGASAGASSGGSNGGSGSHSW
jgi:uncharacterized membrane protein